MTNHAATRIVDAQQTALTAVQNGDPTWSTLAQSTSGWPKGRRSGHSNLPKAARHQLKAWLARNPRITLHFTPTSAPWMNMVEIFFGIITRQAIRRGTFANVGDIIAAIRRFIDAYNDRCEPFKWTKTADQILAQANRPKTSDTRH